MKQFIITIAAAMLVLAADANAGIFDNGEKERRIQAEQQLQQERGATGGWIIVAGVLGIGAVVLFTIGCALGSKILRDHGKR